MANKNRVVASFNDDGDMKCVDVFCRPDGTYGFEEYRRDIEDGRGWFAVGGFTNQTFDSAAAALSQARRCVVWFTLRT